METGECARKALWRVIAVFEGNIDNLGVRREQLLPGEGEPPHTHIVAERITAQQSEHALKIKRRRTGLFRRPRVIRGLRDVLLNIVYRFAYPCYPVHAFSPCARTL